MAYESCFFFFSSRRRHTRCSRDWSSDECSSDLLKTGQDADLGGVTDTGGDFAGQNGGHQFVASGLVEDKRCPGNKLAASRQQNNVLEKLQRPRAAAILVVDFAVHVIGIGQVNQPGARFEVAVVSASKPQGTRRTPLLFRPFLEIEEHELARGKKKTGV